MRLVKWIVKLVFSLILFLIILVTVPTVLMYKSVTTPEIEEQETFNLDEFINEQVERLFLDSNKNKEVGIYLKKEQINAQIYKMIVEAMQENLTNDDGYLADFEYVKLQGVWVDFKNDIININVGFHLTYKEIKYKSRLLIGIKFEDFSQGQMVFRISKFNVGNFPLKWLVRVAPEVYRIINGERIDDLINESLQGLGKYYPKKQQVVINVVDFIGDSTDGNSTMNALLEILSTDGLVDIGVSVVDEEYQLRAVINVNNLLSDKEAFKLNEEDKFQSDEDIQVFMKNKALAGIINQSIQFNDLDLNRLIGFMFSSSSDDGYLFNQELRPGIFIRGSNPYFEVGSNATFNIPIEITNGEGTLKSHISLDVRFAKQNNDLKLNFKNAVLGQLSISDDLLSLLLDSISMDGFVFSDMSITIKDFFNAFTNEEFKIKNIIISDDKININLDTQDPIQILDDILGEFDDNIQVKDIANKLLDKIMNEEDITEELDELLDIYENLTEEEQNRLYELMEKYLKEGFN